jgi:hypothetical protein
MLTLKPRMDHMGRPTDLFTPTPNLIRQASAEDLDAAHQLVSSARGGRRSLSGSDDRSRLGDGHAPFLDGGSSDRVSDSLATNDQPMLSGQICRWDKDVSSNVLRGS